MKIGELAKTMDIPINAIRYYINLGLLVPKSKNKQYDFSQDDLKDLQEIIKLKQLKFSLNDIHKIISFKRFSNLADRGDIEDYLKFFVNQREELISEKHKIDQTISSLNEEIGNIRHVIDSNHHKSGVPLNMIHLIYCPHCQKQLNLKDAYIEGKYILSGSFFCDCGYQTKIKEGILITKGGWISKYDFPDLDRSFYKNIPAHFISVLQNSYNWLLDQIGKTDTTNKVIMEDHMNAYVFSYRHIELLDRNAFYILTDKYYEIVKMYKERIDTLNLDMNILYIADSTFELPIKNNCVDIFFDFFSSNEYAFFNHSHLMDKVDPYFHSGTDIFGTYFSFKPGSKSLKQAILDYPETWEKNFDLANFKKHFITSQKYDLIDEVHVGSVLDSGTAEAFSFHKLNEEMNLDSFHWSKT